MGSEVIFLHTSRPAGKYAFARVANFVNKYVELNLSCPVSMEGGKFVKPHTSHTSRLSHGLREGRGL